MNTIRWVVPESREPAVAEPAGAVVSQPRAPSRRLRLGLLDNTKDNARLLLELIAEQVQAEFELDVLLRRKPHPSMPVDPQMLDELAEADCVITATAD